MIAPMANVLIILLAVALLAVLAVLMIGVVGMARGGEFNRKHSNRLMRWRVGLQFLAVVLFLLLIFSASRG